MGFDFAGDQISSDDTARLPIDHDQVQHFSAWEHRHSPGGGLPQKGLIGSQQKLLPRLSARIKSPGNLRSAKRPVRQHSPVLARERNALRYTLVDDVQADLGQAVNVGFAGPEVSAFHGVVEESINAVAVVLIILRSVDTALRRDTVGAPGTVLEAETFHVIAELGHGRRRRCAGQSRSDDDDAIFPLVRRIHQLHFKPVPVPPLLDRPGWNHGLQFHSYLPRPASTASGTEMNPAINIQEKIAANFLIIGVKRGWLNPIDWNMLQTPW